MTDPTPASHLVASSVAAGALALIGVPWPALFWGFVGAIAMLAFTPPSGSAARAMFSVMASGLVGAGVGHAVDQAVGHPPGILLAASLIVGAGAKVLILEAVETARQSIVNARAWLEARFGGPK